VGEGGFGRMTDEKGLDVTPRHMVVSVPMPDMRIETDLDVERALARATGADRRTVKRWLSGDPKARGTTAAGLRAAAAELGLTERVEAMRGAAR